MERPDFIFSYWILVWFIVYKLHGVDFSPKLIFLVALFESLCMVVFMIRVSYKYILPFLVSIVVLKIIPLVMMASDPYRWRDVYATLGIMVLYAGWMKWNRKQLFWEVFSHISSVRRNLSWGPLTNLLRTIL